MTQEEKTKIEERIVDVLKTVYDPEIPVNIWDLGMIYKLLRPKIVCLKDCKIIRTISSAASFIQA